MAAITRYVLVDEDNYEGDWEYDSYDEAVAAAGLDHAVVERTYVFDDSELVWTPNGSMRWPEPPQDPKELEGTEPEGEEEEEG